MNDPVCDPLAKPGQTARYSCAMNGACLCWQTGVATQDQLKILQLATKLLTQI